MPYRAEFNIKNYYIHVSDDSIIPSPVILRRLFYPQSLAKLEMRVILSSSRKECDGVPTDLWRYQVFLKNAGRATAHEVLPRQESFASLHILTRRASEGSEALPSLARRVSMSFFGARVIYILITDKVPYDTALGKGLYQGDNWQTKVSLPTKSGFYSQIPIHPEFPTLIATSHEWNPAGHTVYEGRIYPAFPTVRIRNFAFCHDTEHQIFEVEFSTNDFVSDDICDKECSIVTDPGSLIDL